MKNSNPNSDKSKHDPEFRFAKILGRTAVYYPRQQEDPIPTEFNLSGRGLEAINRHLPWFHSHSLTYRKYLSSTNKAEWHKNLVATALNKPQDLRGFQEDYLYGRFTGSTKIWDHSAWGVSIGALSSGRLISLSEILVLYPKDGGPETPTLERDPIRRFPTYMLIVAIEQTDGLCYWCHTAFTPDNQAVADHYFSWASGGRTSQENCVAACVVCNQEKGDMHPKDWAQLLFNRQRQYGRRGRKLG